ncbi:MAG: sodium-dependent bicarbonate transport family permease [Verrucomicrobiales bacterium]|nr:sodium-dependent bicarbonate transport family permease [Verrucomicrobiales bacterium]MDP5004218.1 sodium-dependent bicarbonate transport family permease [Verrucomicrobiales bacterium]
MQNGFGASGWRLIVSGCDQPLGHGFAGTIAGHLAGLSPGGAAAIGAMVGSAYYIAAPAPLRMALPKASPGMDLTLSLEITFPFNPGVGIPASLACSKTLESFLP